MAQIRWQTRHPQVQKAPPLELSHPGQRLIRGSDPMAQDSCSLDEPGKPSFVEHRSRLPSSQIARASSGRASYLAHNEAGAPARPNTADPAAPRRSSADECLPLHGAPWWPEGRGHGRQARFPHQGACTGGSRLRFPSLRLVFQKMPSSCDNFGGRNWVRTSDPSLVRRNEVRIAPGFPGRFMDLNCEDHARRCPRVPGIVCTVVPASGSRSRTGNHDSPA